MAGEGGPPRYPRAATPARHRAVPLLLLVLVLVLVLVLDRFSRRNKRRNRR
jgi:hypothetical protein